MERRALRPRPDSSRLRNSITFGHLWFYWGPPSQFRMALLWLSAGYFWFNLCDNGGTVASNAAATELFPTPLRGTMIGWFALVSAVGAVISKRRSSSLGKQNGRRINSSRRLINSRNPRRLLFGLMIDETRGLSLETAAKEAQFTSEN